MHLSETILLLSFLLALGIFARGLVRKAAIPYTVLLVFIGLGVGELSRRWIVFAAYQELTLTPELVLFVFLPVLIFESGLKLDCRQLIKDIVPVLTLAVPALLISTAIIGIGLWLVLSIKLTTALLFGALISATDPVAVVALFKELGTPQRLTVLVEGESLLNDATAIVLFNILLGMALFGGGSVGDILPAVGNFVKIFTGGALVGAVFGLAASFLVIRLALGTHVVMTLTLVVAYAAFILTEHYLHFSGVMAVAVSAVFLGIFGIPKLTQNSTRALQEIWDFLALMANTFLFIMVGILVNVSELLGRMDSILLAVLLVFAARASVIYSFVPLTVKGFGLPKVTMGERHIMWWGGLKGGLAIAIVLSIPDEMAGKTLLLDLTLGVVMFTLLVNAPTIRPLINFLGINRLDDQEMEELKQGVILARDNARHVLGRLLAAGVLSRGSYHRVDHQIANTLVVPETSSLPGQNILHARLQLLRIEMATLSGLYQEGVIQQYIFLDLKGELQRKREHVIGGIRSDRSIRARKHNLFLRLEDALVGFLRERDFAAGLLAHYQNVRLSQHLLKDVARILMTRAALEHLPALDFLSEAEVGEIRESYAKRLALFSGSIHETRQDFSEFYQRFEGQLSCRAALAGALSQAEDEWEHGVMGAKAYANIERTIERELVRIPPISVPVAELGHSELIGLVPLFQGLPIEVLNKIAGDSHVVTFLMDDTVIGEGDHGDALYVIVRGEVGVYRRNQGDGEKQLSILAPGDFFGETALLGNSIRTATVRALKESKLLRITSRTVKKLAEQHPLIAERLEKERIVRDKSV